MLFQRHEGGRKYLVNLVTYVFSELPLEKVEINLNNDSKRFFHDFNLCSSSSNDIFMIFYIFLWFFINFINETPDYGLCPPRAL